MKKYLRPTALGAWLLACAACVPPLLRAPAPAGPDPERASTSAVIFAKEAFVDRNQPAAYALLSPEMRRERDFDQYVGLISRLHPKGFPDEVVASDYLPDVGGTATLIWLTGEGGGEKFFYWLRVEGAGDASYKVSEVMRVVDAPAYLSWRPLQVRRSTAGLR